MRKLERFKVYLHSNPRCSVPVTSSSTLMVLSYRIVPNKDV